MRILLVVFVFLFAGLAGCSSDTSESPLFTRLDSTQTGVGFQNVLHHTDSLSILDYLYFYNGGGVAAGDLNNDGLTDLYFVANQEPNRLYINQTKGKDKLNFIDATQKSGVAGRANWQTGVTMADVNGDGWLDIYVCAVSKYKGLQGRNELYINNGDGQNGVPTFTERAAEYGLDFAGFSTQAAFFDYDHDGDLDCFLLNHAVHTARSFDKATTRTTRNAEAGDYLFRNDGPKTDGTSQFVDVSAKAGIFGALMGYGLGLAVADLNNDGWEDLYVSNDFHEDDYYYVNNHDGTFTESIKKAFQHTSRFSMGSDIADVNNDGFPDVITTDMYPEAEAVEKASQGEDPFDIYQYKLTYGYMNQYSRNCLQLSVAGQQFIDIGAMAGVAATDWSWSPLLADFDNDGIKDLFVSNGIRRRPNNLDYVKYMNEGRPFGAGNQAADDQQTINLMPDGKVHNFLYRGTNSVRFEDKSVAWGFDTPTCSNGAAYADLDNDGDLDLITNDIDSPAGLYLNNATTLFPENQHLTVRLRSKAGNTFGVGAKVILRYDSAGVPMRQVQQLMPTRGFESASAPELLFGLGKQSTIDSLVVLWPTGQMEVRRNVNAGQLLTLNQTDASLDGTTFRATAPPTKQLFTELTGPDTLPYQHRENTQYLDFVHELLMPFKVSTEGPRLATADVNGDGLPDVYAGGARNQPGRLLMQQPDRSAGTGQFRAVVLPAFRQDSLFEDVDAVFFDADGDKDADLYVVSGGNEFRGEAPQQLDRLYLNDGRGNFSRATNALPLMYETKSCVRPVDVDGDGDLDLFVGSRVVGYSYGKIPKSYLLINDGRGQFTDQTDKLAPGLRQAGMITDALWVDYDGDKDADLILSGDWMPIRLFANTIGKLTEVTDFMADDRPMNGFYQRIAAADFDGDGDLDLVAANLGTNTKLRKTTDATLRMFVKDIDNNKTTEQIIAYDNRSGNVLYPLAFKDELGKQMPGIINKRFTDYVSFAGKPLTDVLTITELAGADELTVNQFASVYLENQNGKFGMHTLPMLAQVSKLFALLPFDMDGDGDLDLLGGGNFSGVSTYQGRYDGSFGLVLQNDGKANFTALSPVYTGFLLNGEIRDVLPVQTPRGPLLLVARNNASIQTFRPIR